MSRINRKVELEPIYTYEGAVAKRINAEQQLRRSILSCFLWENEFYEDGKTIANRIAEFAAKVDKDKVAALAVEARASGLRHAPLMLLLDLIKRGGNGVAKTITDTIQRPDEITELVALYWKFNPNKDLSAQMKKGLAGAFEKFNEYSLAKYNQDNAVKLRDVLFLSHVKPANPEREALYKRLANNELVTPDTWEVALSAGKDKGETFTRLIEEGKLGYMALLRNLRNMVQANVSTKLIREAIAARKGSQYVLPFRYLAAAKVVPQFEPDLESALLDSLKDAPKLVGKTALVVDVSGSMQAQLSAKSDMKREDAASSLAMILRELCDEVDIFATGGKTVYIPARRGIALRDAIKTSGAGYDGIYLTLAMDFVSKHNKGEKYDRVIVITDEQDCGHGSAGPQNAKINGKANYLINVASARNGIGYGKWTHIDGFSEGVVRYIQEIEKPVDVGYDGDRRGYYH